jgi:hypothetical protein
MVNTSFEHGHIEVLVIEELADYFDLYVTIVMTMPVFVEMTVYALEEAVIIIVLNVDYSTSTV